MKPYLGDLLAVDLKAVLWGHWSLINHFQGKWSENLLLSLTSTALVSSTEPGVSTRVVVVEALTSTGGEKAWIVIRELHAVSAGRFKLPCWIRNCGKLIILSAQCFKL